MKKIIISALLLTANLVVSAQQLTRMNATTVQVQLENKQSLYIDFYGPNIFRLFQDPEGGIIRNPEANPPAQILVDNPRRKVDGMSIENNTISVGNLKVSLGHEGELLVTRNGQEIIRQVSPTSFGRSNVSMTFEQGPNDWFYGGGVQNGRFSHKGQSIDIRNTNNWVDGGVASPTPFYWSTRGYGIMWHTFAPGVYDFGKSKADETILSHDVSYLDVFFMINDGAVALLNDFYQLTGNPVLLPKFGFYEGHLNAYNRDYWKETEAGKNGFMTYEDGKQYNESQKDNGGIHESLNGEKDNYQFSARAAIDRYLDNDYPLGWFLPNDGYGAGYGQTGSLEGNIQNLKEFGEYARKRGVEIGLWTQSDLHPKEGIEPLLQRDIVGEVRDAGVRVLKTDVAWVGAGYSFGLNGVADVAQVMPYYGAQARPFIISLDGWAGTQRYATIWTGDQTGGEWEYIRFHIPTYIGSGLSGQPNITSDMDGIFGGKNIPVNVRDFQWKAFTPMQLNMDGWGSNPKYPQALGEPAASINRYYLKLKSHFLPYAYSIAREAVDGKPMIRAMMLEEENDFTRSKRADYQFMFGPNILVAPIYKETRANDTGDDVRDGIYLPHGQWMDYFTGEIYQGGRIINDFEAPLWKLPILIRMGAIIPTHKPTNTPAEIDLALRCYDIYPAQGANSFTEYDDDGRTDAYLCGESAHTTITQLMDRKGMLKVTIQKTEGTYEGFVPEKVTQVRIYSQLNPQKITVKVGGRKLALTQVEDYNEWKSTPNSYYYGVGEDTYRKTPALMVNIAKTEVTQNEITLTTQVAADTTCPLMTEEGTLQKPDCHLTDEGITAYTLTPSWDKIEGADYYELLFEDQLYSTILQTQYTLDGLQPMSNYDIKVRAVNAQGTSGWTDIQACTTEDPLKHAIRDMRGSTTCANQPGQKVGHLFDFDEGSVWHTAWSQKAVPFDITIDTRCISHIESLRYIPRSDAGNGTLLAGSVSLSTDGDNWTDAGTFNWEHNGEAKNFDLTPHSGKAWRYIRMHITSAAGDFGSGCQIYVFRQPNTPWYIPGDINQDGKIDDNDLTSYMNYTGLREGDGDFAGYISKGDLNGNGLIDAYDISAVATELEGGIYGEQKEELMGDITIEADKKQYTAGETVTLTVTGTGMQSVNALSMCLPYDATELEYVGIEVTAVKDMYNMTYDRLHTNGQKALYPTFVNLGMQNLLKGDAELMKIVFKARKNMKWNGKVTDSMLVSRHMKYISR
ncbi:MAG: TIM-barrel domain-containing protein [Bacteroidaceae bacterium]